MKFPSIKNLARGAKNTIIRFPIELLFALAGTIAATVNVELNNLSPEAESWCTRVIMIGNLGLLLSLSATLFTESRGTTGSKKWSIKIAAVILTVLLLLLIDPEKNQADYIRFFLLSLAFHLLVAYAAFTNKGHIQGFWQFNKTLFLRFLTSVLYSSVLYAGLAAALGAMNLLFNFKFESDTFSILWLWIVGIFSTMFFLAGVPANYAQLDEDAGYPKGLKVFTQYVLIPLATIYLVILIAYEAKILVQWNLPKGYVSYLILGYAVFGILSLLLVYPIREHEENRWLKTFARSFYFLLLPLLMLLFVAVGTRVFDYGITEQRYFLIMLAIWLLFISVYFLAFKKQNIKLIPISLSIVTLVSIYGPQGAFSISQYSQKRILVNLFERHHAVKEGRLIAISTIDSADGANATDKLRYLIYQHDLISLQPYVNKDLKAVSDSIAKQKGRYNSRFRMNRYEQRQRNLEWVIRYLGLKKYGKNRYDEIGGVDVKDSYAFKTNDIVSIKGNDYMVDVNGADTDLIKFDGISFKRKVVDYTKLILVIDGEEFIFKDDELAKGLLKRNDLKKYAEDDDRNAYLVPPDLLTLTKQGKNYKVTVIIDNFSFGKLGKEKIQPMYVGGTYLIKKLH